MPHIARMIRAARWNASPEERASGELPADPLGDLVTKENVLSVFLVEDKSAQLDSVMAALAATRHRPANAHCVLLDTQHFDKLALRRETTEGDTPNPEVNRLHRNLTDLTATALVRLARISHQTCGQPFARPRPVRSCVPVQRAQSVARCVSTAAKPEP